jgi:hypothetical protein
MLTESAISPMSQPEANNAENRSEDQRPDAPTVAFDEGDESES